MTLNNQVGQRPRLYRGLASSSQHASHVFSIKIRRVSRRKNLYQQQQHTSSYGDEGFPPGLPARHGLVVTAVFIHSVARVAHRIALYYILPGRRLLTTASRAAGNRVSVLALCCVQVILSCILYLERRFGLKDKIIRTLSYKSEIDKKIVQMKQTPVQEDGMVRAVLNKTKRNLSSMSTMDSSDEEEYVLGRARFVVDDSNQQCPLCHGTGTIDYEGKLKHTNEPCPRCLGSGKR